MPRAPPRAILVATAALLLLTFFVFFNKQPLTAGRDSLGVSSSTTPSSGSEGVDVGALSQETLKGTVVAGKLGNETIK